MLLLVFSGDDIASELFCFLHFFTEFMLLLQLVSAVIFLYERGIPLKSSLMPQG